MILCRQDSFERKRKFDRLDEVKAHTNQTKYITQFKLEIKLIAVNNIVCARKKMCNLLPFKTKINVWPFINFI